MGIEPGVKEEAYRRMGGQEDWSGQKSDTSTEGGGEEAQCGR